MGKSVVDIYIDGKVHRFSGPKDWNSMSRKELLLWCGLGRQYLEVDTVLKIAAYCFYRIPKSVFRHFKAGEDLALADQMKWLLDNKLTNNLIGRIRIGWKVYYGPANRLSNLTIGEYRRADLFHQMYIKTGKKDYLLGLAATLFREKGGNAINDVRCELTENGVSNRAKFFKWALHPTLLKAIQLFYEGSRADIVRRFPVVFQTPEGEGKPTESISDLEDTILAYSGGKLGNFEETNRNNVYIFFTHLKQKIEEYNRNKK